MQTTRVFITMEIYETYNQSITSTHYELCHDSSMCNVRSLTLDMNDGQFRQQLQQQPTAQHTQTQTQNGIE